jgi:predicted alpha/beta-hydrolase family hydrolase
MAIDVDTPHGLARAHLHPAEGARGALVLGHGAGGGVSARDLVTAADVALSLDVSVALVEQPYRVAGRRSAAPAAQLDLAWTTVIGHLRSRHLADGPLVVGGRSSGARVACRTAESVGAAGVLCLAFPLQPRARVGKPPSPSRLAELDALTCPVLVVQGARDPFGIPPPGERRAVVAVRGDHSLRSDLEAVADAVREWLPSVIDTGA